MAQLSIQDIIRMMGADNQQLAAMNPDMNFMKQGMMDTGGGMFQTGGVSMPIPMNTDLAAMQMQRTTAPSGMENVSDMEMQRLAQAMGTSGMGESPALSLPANEMQRNYADGQAPIAIGGGLLADEAQMLMNTAYDMSAPREMRINAINRLRELGY